MEDKRIKPCVIVPDFVISAQTDPRRKGAVLLDFLGEQALSAEGLDRTL